MFPKCPSPYGSRTGKIKGPRDPGMPTGSYPRRLLNSPTGIFAVLLLLTILFPVPTQAKEESASLLFRMTAGQDKQPIHVVKQGEWITRIFRNRFGDKPVPYALIRRLNPGIRNLNVIHPGQQIVLPSPGESDPSGSATDRPEEGRPPALYRIQEEDSISRIILLELNVNPSEALSAYRQIRKLNPEIENMNSLPVGRTLRMPASYAPPSVPDAAPSTAVAEETGSSGMTADAGTAAPDAFPAVVRTVIQRMRGAVTASGNHFIPLQETTQMLIDCSLIPVVELDDGTTVLLDRGNRLPTGLKELVRESWKNYGFLTAEELGDDLSTLQAILRHSPNYRMVRTDQPLKLAVKPEIAALPDWAITGRETAGNAVYRQGLFLLDPEESALPPGARALLEKSGMVVTEIAGSRVVSSGQTMPLLRPPSAHLHDLKGMAVAERLLALLGETPAKNAEVVVFDQARNGYNLHITVDLLLRKGERQIVLHTKKLPDSFVRILREAGTDVVPIKESDPARTTIESVLQALSIPVSFGHFTFRIPEEGKRTRVMVSFSALRVSVKDEWIYLVDFDAPVFLPAFLNGRQKGRFVRY